MVVYVIWFVLFELSFSPSYYWLCGGFLFLPHTLSSPSSSSGTYCLAKLTIQIYADPARLLPDVVWQNWNYISNLDRIWAPGECCLAKREIYFQFPVLLSEHGDIVWQKTYYALYILLGFYFTFCQTKLTWRASPKIL